MRKLYELAKYALFVMSILVLHF